jgi:hypothetical protein
MDARKGQELWKRLHDFAQANESSPQAQESFFVDWFLEVEAAIGCASCYRKLFRFVKFWPPDFGGNFYFWTICLHDYVNKELGKPLHFPELTIAPLRLIGLMH